MGGSECRDAGGAKEGPWKEGVREGGRCDHGEAECGNVEGRSERRGTRK